MTNREWLLKEIQNASDEKLAESIRLSNFTDHCKGDCNILGCIDCKLEWLKQEHEEPIVLSEAERAILENLDKCYKWIARDKDEELFIYAKMPAKGKSVWISNGINLHFCMFNQLFQFVRWEGKEPYSVEKLLNN